MGERGAKQAKQVFFWREKRSKKPLSGLYKPVRRFFTERWVFYRL